MRAPILPFVVVLILALGAAGMASAIEVPLGWTWDQVELRQNDAGETEVKIAGTLPPMGEAGEPGLPGRVVRIEAPDGHRVASFELIASVTSARRLEAPVAPIEEQRPSDMGGPVRVEPRADAYAAPAFPAERVRFTGITLHRGTAYANFLVYPVVLQDGESLLLLEGGVLSVSFAPDASVPLPLKSLRPQGSRGGAATQGALRGRPGAGFSYPLAGPGSQVTPKPSETSAPVD
jgi:hypothetical protein